eukprot:CAMPEP_0184361358 /NCGR_PEP_ID=MMETSP1089-20130417/129762_1 /TAXON_ID=38269 ORGANISM="Gloeochaete wittrockiana, Strain SAG46.84" /NCGR_SAMPLE_ID=MMETSP1089 /ASSEMBLY_ACC=CAM_ASM_000445 /LENGTH=362 /DNA_ID=CAMNT_0026700983 /DNA_START=85 /DNA_END=1173 /DNA_ORIENTATION=+
MRRRKLRDARVIRHYYFHCKSESAQNSSSGEHTTFGVNATDIPMLIDRPGGEREEGVTVTPIVEDSNHHLIAVGIINVITFLYSTNFSIVKDMESSVHPSISSALRFSLAAMCFLPFVRNADTGLVRAGVELGTWSWAGYVAQAYGLQYTEASKSSFIAALTVVFVPLLERVLFHRHITPRNWAAVLLALAGVSVLESGGPVGIGDVWSFGMPLCWSMSFIRLEKYAPLYASVPLAGVQLTTIACLSWLWAAVEHPSVNISTLPWLEVAYTGLVTTALTISLEAFSLKYVTAVEATVWCTLEPVWALLFSTIFLSEHLGSQAILGSALILSACFCSQLAGLQLKLQRLLKSMSMSMSDSHHK